MKRSFGAFVFWIVLTQIIISVSAFGAVDPLDTWQQTGPYGAQIQSLAIDPTTPQTVYAGTNEGIFKSINGGGNWSVVNTGQTTFNNVRCLSIDPSTPQIIYAGIDDGNINGGVFKSVNGGGSWSAVKTGLNGGSAVVRSLAIDPSTPQTIYAGTVGGVYKSVNGGGSWSTVNKGLLYIDVYSLAIDPSTPQTVYAGTEWGLFKSVNGGESWSAIKTGLTGTSIQSSLAVDPSNPQTVYTGTDGGVFKSVNGGGNWSVVNTGLTTKNIYSLAIDPVTPQTVYAGTYEGNVFKTVNGGGSWSAVNTGLPTNTSVYSLAIDPYTPQTVYAGTFGGVFNSVSGGGGWSAVNTGLLSKFEYVSSYYEGPDVLAIDPSTPQTVYARTNGGVSKSVNGGESWSAVNTGLPTNTSVYSLAIDPATPQTVYVGTWEEGVFKSVNGGENWNAVNSGLPTNIIPLVYSLAIDPSTPGTVYAGTNAGVYKSVNGGGNWSYVGIGKKIHALAIDPSTPQTVYAGTNGGVFKSVNGGENWNSVNAWLPSNTIFFSLAIDPSTPPTVYAGAYGGVYKSVSGGEDWSLVGIERIYYSSGVYTSGCIFALAIARSTPQTLYAGTNGGIFKSVNGGGSWNAVNTGLPPIGGNPPFTVYSLAIDPSPTQSVYAGTSEGGVFKMQSGSSAPLTISKSGSGSGSVTSSPAGISCGAACSASFATGTSVTLTATPDSGSAFAGWSGNCNGTGTCTVTMDAAKSVGAVFNEVATPIDGACGSSNNGTFTASPAANLCTSGTASTVTGSGPWSWSCTGSNGGTDATCSANIQLYTVAATVTGGNGTVSCTGPVKHGSDSVCAITPSSGFQLASLTDDTVDKTSAVASGSYTITNVTANHTVTANFERKIYDDGIWVITLGGDSGPSASPVAVSISGVYADSATELKISHLVSPGSWPQLFSIKGNGYLRSIPPGGEWGTSFVTTGFWKNGAASPVHGLKVRELAVSLANSRLVLRGKAVDDVADPGVEATDFTITLDPPAENRTEMEVSYTLKAVKPLTLNAQRQANHEGFRIAQFSSMYLNTTNHDADAAVYLDISGNRQQAALANNNTFIFPSPAALGGDGILQLLHSDKQPRNTPAVMIQVIEPQQSACTPQGWVKQTADSNDDNAGGWINWDGAPSTVDAGATIGIFRYRLSAIAPLTPAVAGPGAVSFAAVEIGSSAVKTARVANHGSSDLVIDHLSLLGNAAQNYSLSNDSCSGATLAPLSGCTTDVTFSPVSTGDKSVNLVILSSDPAAPDYDIPVTGSGVDAPDVSVPSVTAFNMPLSSTTLAVLVSAFAATDNISVTGYLITESATPPLASDSAWSATAATQYTFSSAGAKTLYAWARDAAGNVSAYKSATINIFLKSGDCDGSGIVTIAEVQSAINMFLQIKTVAGCVDTSADGKVSISEVQKVINGFLGS